MSTNVKLASQNLTSLPRQINILMLIVWIAGAIDVMLPLALDTSPLDALLMRVPNNEGNWWHVLIGLPFFLALPMIWLRWRLLNSPQLSILAKRILWAMVIVSAIGTLLVETPFLLQLAGTSLLQRWAVIFSGIGIIVICGIFLYIKRKKLYPGQASIISLTGAYLSNASICLIIFGEAKFKGLPRSGWYVTLIIAIPMLIELIWLLLTKSELKNS